MADVVIRAAVGEDADPVRSVIRAAYEPWTRKLADLPDVSAGVTEDIAARRVWVSVIGEMVCGCLIGGVVSKQWHVANVAVSPDFGGRGIGRALMTFALAQAGREGVAEMVLATHRDMPGNVALYERLGWQVSGEVGNKIMMRRGTDA